MHFFPDGYTLPNDPLEDKFMNVLAETTEPDRRLRMRVRGVVQGVGFRPFVYGCALQCNLRGLVGNESGGVFIEVEGSSAALIEFQRQLRENAPPLAHITEITSEEIPLGGDTQFLIVESASRPSAHTLISPDISICADCLRELFDPQDRRYRYPFINCTNCGPRFTIIRDIPYDRPLTTMAGFLMCGECRQEYDDPHNRRFHAQPNACPNCGPQLSFVRASNAGAEAAKNEAVAEAQHAFSAGMIVAVKGIGGFHLACDARNDDALAHLRQRKGRVDKPFAVMARDLEIAEKLAEISTEERALLLSKECPIVLLRKKANNGLSEQIAPGNDYLGLMLPYSPLHHLLFHPAVGGSSPIPNALVMTSGNYSDEPIVKDNEEALNRLAPLADGFLLHNRGIHVPCDDSVIRVFEAKELPIRRSRGYAPFPVTLPFRLPPLLAVGGELKNTFCLVKEDCALLSQHIGDMENLETLEAFQKSLAQMKAIFRVEPEIVAGDKHPRYLSAQWAQGHLAHISSRAERYVAVQHHHAHIAAVMAENQLTGERPVIGFSFDGTGYGEDGAIWGGEVLIADYRGFNRAAHLQYLPLPGGDASIKRPYRVALAYLWAAGVEWDEALPPVRACPLVERKVLRQQLEKQLHTAPTSSMGRLFDAIASLAGVRQTVTYEAQAAIEFETLIDETVSESYAFSFREPAAPGKPLQIDCTPIVRAVAADVLSDRPVPVIAAKFHRAVAELILQLAIRLRAETGLRQIALSGGVFQNVTLLKAAKQQLHAGGFEVFTHSQVPPNDGGLALGQAVIAGLS